MKRILAIAAAIVPMLSMAETSLNFGRWNATLADDNKLKISYNGADAMLGVYATTNYRLVDAQGEGSLDSRSLQPTASIVSVSDEFGSGKSLTISYTDGTATMTQHLSFYDAVPYMVASVTLTANDGGRISANRMVPFATATQSSPLKGSTNRMLWVPFDNDGHGRYEVYDFNRQITSHEVSMVYDAGTRYGLVAGSVDHDKWKSGITFKGSGKKNLVFMECLSGLTNQYTRDQQDGKITPHGYVRGEEVGSARYMIGFFDDWRVGMETFADACNLVAPRAIWEGGNPMGWSSWGVMMDHVNYESTVETATFIKENLFEYGFYDKDGQTVLSLDSFAEGNIGTSNMARLGKYVLGTGTYRENGKVKQGLDQRLGTYGGMVVWEWTFDGTVSGTGLAGAPVYKWKDCALKVDGKYHRVHDNSGCQYYAIDPTHPALRANLEDAFKRWSENYKVKYVKVDFINSGICEGDSWYDPEVTTGVMAYNYGMSIMLELAEKYGMYLVESMAPLFPYRWAHGRRTMCDRFSELGESEYVMNGISWAWWTDRLYTVNDPDQMVLHKAGYNAAETLGENRVRATTGMCTGAYIFGDSFSDKCTSNGSVVGYPEKSKARAMAIMTNEDINDYVRNNIGSFRPVEGGNMTSSQQAERQFMRDTEQYLYVAVFNWSKFIPLDGSVSWDRLGIAPSNVGEIKELWSGDAVTPTATGISYTIPGGDVHVYRISKNDYVGVHDVAVDAPEANGAAVYYNLQGVRVDESYRGLCVKVQNGTAVKVYK